MATLTGNDGGGVGIDILATSPPLLIDTTCGKSAVLIFVPGSFADDFTLNVGDPLGVCPGG